jgi:hypothetical protein
MKSYLTAWRAAFPNTNLVVQNTFLYAPTPTQQLGDWMINGGLFIAPSTADSSSGPGMHPECNEQRLLRIGLRLPRRRLPQVLRRDRPQPGLPRGRSMRHVRLFDDRSTLAGNRRAV